MHSQQYSWPAAVISYPHMMGPRLSRSSIFVTVQFRVVEVLATAIRMMAPRAHIFSPVTVLSFSVSAPPFDRRLRICFLDNFFVCIERGLCQHVSHSVPHLSFWPVALFSSRPSGFYHLVHFLDNAVECFLGMLPHFATFWAREAPLHDSSLYLFVHFFF